MIDETIPELGVDINSSCNFENGDLIIIRDEANLIQAVVNRLKTDLNELELFYDSDYGSVVRSFLGWKTIESTLEYIQMEIDNTLLNEPRIMQHETTVSYQSKGTFKINLKITTSNEDIIETNLVMESDGTIDVESDDEDEDEEE